MGRNFVTPDVHRYYVGKRGCYELSSGEGVFDNKRLWGATVTRDKINRDYKASGCFESEHGAMQHICELEEKDDARPS